MRTTTTRCWRSWVYGGLLAVAVLGTLAFLTISWQIGSDVRAASTMAVREYGGDRVSALIAYADAQSHTLGDRNRAVWALGHIGDPRALPVLQKHYTGKPCDHGQMLCQRELHTAIGLCRGGINLPALVWRHGAMSAGDVR
jgi:hypothetical protein